VKFLDVLGKVGALGLKGYSEYMLKDPLESQIRLLGSILRKNRSTNFGKDHRFDEITSIQRFQANCPTAQYDAFKPYIDAIIAGTKNALTNRPLLFLAQTTGTTGTPKLIPVTTAMANQYNLGILRAASYYVASNPRENARVTRGQWLYLPAPALIKHLNGIPVGYITGLLALPTGRQAWRFLVNHKLYTPPQLLNVKNLEAKYQIIAKDCASRNITVITGITPIVVNLMEYLVKNAGVDGINTIFPNLQLAILSGVSPVLYETRLKKLVGPAFEYREVYAASEGMLAIQTSARTGLVPLYDSIFFEFVPVNHSTEERLLLTQTRKGEEYSVLITTRSGLYAYEIGDIVKFVSEDPPAFTISFRKNTIDLAGEKLTPMQALAAIQQVNVANNCMIIDFRAIGLFKPRSRYIFLIEFDPDSTPRSYEAYLRDLDRALIELNGVYQDARTNKGTLVPPELWILKEGTFHELEKEKLLASTATGQTKASHLSIDQDLLGIFEDHVIDTKTI